MSWRNSPKRYGSAAIALHWLMLALLIAVYASMELKSVFPKKSPERELMAFWHYSLGLSVFVLVWLRLLFRASGPAPAIEPPPSIWQAKLALAVHWGMYALMIGLPLLGWLTLSARGAPVSFFGAELPALIGRSKSLAETLKEVHEFLATAGYFLVGMHALAALFHHYVRRDNTLRLMLPVLQSGTGMHASAKDTR